MEWTKKYRPANFKDLVGQDGAVEVLQSYLKSNTLPHAILLTGQTGGGKTTLARILRKKLKCVSDLCYEEINVADDRGIAKVRDVKVNLSRSPVGGDCRIYVFDEIHRMSHDGMSAMLKITEDTPDHVYLIACTTDPDRLLKALRDRFTRIEIKPVDAENLKARMFKILELEQLDPPPDTVLDKIVEVAEGSVRAAVAILEKVMQRTTPEEMLEEAGNFNAHEQAITIARLLVRMKPKATWNEMAKVLKDVNEDAESIRHLILAYATSVLLNGENPRAYLVIEAFEENFFYSKRAGLVKACFDVIKG